MPGTYHLGLPGLLTRHRIRPSQQRRGVSQPRGPDALVRGPRQGRFLPRLRGHRPRPPLGWKVAGFPSRHLPSVHVCVLSSREHSVIGIGGPTHPQHSAELDRLQIQPHPEVLGVGRQQEFHRDTMHPTTSPDRDPLTSPSSRSSRGCAGLQSNGSEGSRGSTGPPGKARQGQPRARPGPARGRPRHGAAGRTRGGTRVLSRGRGFCPSPCALSCATCRWRGGGGWGFTHQTILQPEVSKRWTVQRKKQLVLLPSRADRRTQTGRCTLKIAPCQRGVPTALLPGAALLLGRTGQLIIVRLALP